jgi:hypothetical protein
MSAEYNSYSNVAAGIESLKAEFISTFRFATKINRASGL